jgi:hypothetical protein
MRITGGFLALLLVVLASCKTVKQPEASQLNSPGPPAIVYKTTADYSAYVPVSLSADRDRIIQYPAPQDVLLNGATRKPISLSKGYLLDDIGIGPNTVYLNITCDQYFRLPEPPPADSMLKMISSFDPFVEMYNCGNRNAYSDAPKQLNSLIKKGLLSEKCVKLK